jgi:hypothetical protein
VKRKLNEKKKAFLADEFEPEFEVIHCMWKQD